MIKIKIDEIEVGKISIEKFNKIKRNAYKNPRNYLNQSLKFCSYFLGYAIRQFEGIVKSIFPAILVLLFIFPELFQMVIDDYAAEGLVALIENSRPFIILFLVCAIGFGFAINNAQLILNGDLLDSAFKEEILIKCAEEVGISDTIPVFHNFSFEMVEDPS